MLSMKIILKVCPLLISNYHFYLYFESWISSNWVSSPLFKSCCKTIYWIFIHTHFTIWRKNTATALWKGIIFTSVLCFKRYSFIKFLNKPDSAHNSFSNLTWCAYILWSQLYNLLLSLSKHICRALFLFKMKFQTCFENFGINIFTEDEQMNGACRRLLWCKNTCIANVVVLWCEWSKF